MMNELRQIKKIQEVEFPQHLHGRIMRSIYLRQFKLPLFVINILLLLNLSLSGWHLVRSMGVAENSVLNGAFLARAWDSLATISGGAFSILLLNFFLLAGGIYLFLKLERALRSRPASRTSLLNSES